MLLVCAGGRGVGSFEALLATPLVLQRFMILHMHLRTTLFSFENGKSDPTSYRTMVVLDA